MKTPKTRTIFRFMRRSGRKYVADSMNGEGMTRAEALAEAIDRLDGVCGPPDEAYMLSIGYVVKVQQVQGSKGQWIDDGTPARVTGPD